jgi:hypothetical protein
MVLARVARAGEIAIPEIPEPIERYLRNFVEV